MEAASEIQDDEARLRANSDAVEALRTALGGGVAGTSAPNDSNRTIRPKPQRGRPGRICNWGISAGHEVTKRHGHNHTYAYWAAKAILKHRESHPEVTELTGGVHVLEDGTAVPETKTWKLGPLTELGRLIDRFGDGEEHAVRLAVDLAKMRPKPTSKEAVAWIRNFRLAAEKRERPKGTALGVMEAVCKAVDAYTAAHPGTAAEDVISGIGDALGLYLGMEEERAGDRDEAT